jgi:DNA-binding transcriptional ArsR family regulator
MEFEQAIERCAVLSTASRVKALMLLAKAGKKGIASGALAEELGIEPNTLSNQLKLLSKEKLVESAREGRFTVYRVNLNAIKELIGFLAHDCAAGRVVATVRVHG